MVSVAPTRDGPIDATPVARTIRAVSFPLLFLGVGEALLQFTDTAFLGRVGVAEVGAIALADATLALVSFPVVGLLEALQVVVARRAGERRWRDVGAAFVAGFLLAAAISVVLALVLRLAAGGLSGWMAGSEPVAHQLERFLEIAAFGLPLMALNFAYGALYVGLIRARLLVWATAVLVLVNLGLSYALVLGNLGAPRLGMEGAAIAFVSAEAVTFLLFTVHTVRRRDLRRLDLFRWRPIERAAFRPLVRLGAPVALQWFVAEARWFVFFLFVARVSGSALATSSVIFACYLVLTIPTDAFSEGVYTTVSNVIGRGRAGERPAVLRRGTLTTAVVTAPLLVVALAAPDWVLALFGTGGELAAGAAAALRVVAAAMLVVIPAELAMGALLGAGDVDGALVIETLVSVVIVMGGVAVAALGLSPAQLWLAVPAAALVELVLCARRLHRSRWRLHSL